MYEWLPQPDNFPVGAANLQPPARGLRDVPVLRHQGQTRSSGFFGAATRRYKEKHEFMSRSPSAGSWTRPRGVDLKFSTTAEQREKKKILWGRQKWLERE